jgi:FtsP/CotA-like multicopper oxidase with cupredoxin domain
MLMKKTFVRWIGSSVFVAASALASACAKDAPVTPVAAALPGVTVLADVSDGNRLPDLSLCPTLAAPAGSTLVLHAFGIGFQVYHWNGTTWGAPTPAATIYADAGGQGELATHFAGPTWQSNSGSKVVGTVANRCTVDPASIQWLSLTAVPSGAGIFEKVTFIQRLNTVGGLAPTEAGATIGQEARVPYTADYLFYDVR